MVYSSLVEISDGKGRPVPRRLVLSSTHLHVQRNVHKDAIVDNDADSNRPTHGSVSDRGLSGEGSFDSFVDTDSPPPEYNVSIHFRPIFLITKSSVINKHPIITVN